MKLIESAFLCASAEPRNDGGWNITNLNDHFELSNSTGIFVVFLIVPNYSSGGIYDATPHQTITAHSPHTEFRLGLVIKANTHEDYETQSFDIPVSPKYLALPIGETLSEPGNYTVQMFVDGALEQSLLLFLR